MAANLRAVGKNETAPARRFDSILDATENGTRLDELIMTRRRIAKALDNEDTSPRDLAALTRRLNDTSKEIEALKRQQKEEATHDADTSDEDWAEEVI